MQLSFLPIPCFGITVVRAGQVDWPFLSLLRMQLLPRIKSSEQAKEEDRDRNYRRLDAERKNVSRHPGLQVDVECDEHLNEEDEARGQQDLIFASYGERSPKPWQ